MLESILSAVNTFSKFWWDFVGDKEAKNVPDFIGAAFDEEPITLPSADPSQELGIIEEAARYPEFAVSARRRETFLTWPAGNHKLASDLLEHQLFYTGW